MSGLEPGCCSEVDMLLPRWLQFSRERGENLLLITSLTIRRAKDFECTMMRVTSLPPLLESRMGERLYSMRDGIAH